MACKFCGYDHESTGCPVPSPGVWTSMYQMTEDPKEALKRDRNYQILQAAATIKAARSTEMGVSPGVGNSLVGATSVPTGRTIASYSDEQAVQIAESLLAIIESRSK